MADDKPRPPYWLNPDAILGAVAHGVAYTTVHWVIGIEGHWLKVATMLHNRADVHFMYHRNIKLRPDLWPTKPELAALFGEGTDAT